MLGIGEKRRSALLTTVGKTATRRFWSRRSTGNTEGGILEPECSATWAGSHDIPQTVASRATPLHAVASLARMRWIGQKLHRPTHGEQICLRQVVTPETSPASPLPLLLWWTLARDGLRARFQCPCFEAVGVRPAGWWARTRDWSGQPHSLNSPPPTHLETRLTFKMDRPPTVPRLRPASQSGSCVLIGAVYRRKRSSHCTLGDSPVDSVRRSSIRSP